LRWREALSGQPPFCPPFSDNPLTCGGSAVLSPINPFSLCRDLGKRRCRAEAGNWIGNLYVANDNRCSAASSAVG
jgi:hypothetical protein